MKLSSAISSRSASLAAVQNTYQQNVVQVNTLVTSVVTSFLPKLGTNPPDWDDFTSAYEQANSDALSWVNTVMARLLQVPEDVQTYNSVITQVLQDAQAQAKILLNDPTNTTARSMLNADLTTLSSQMNLVTTFISGAITGIQGFQNNLPDMATQLQTIATKSINDANADLKAIKALNDAIAQLNKDIKQLTETIIALGIVDGVAITLGIVATIAAFPVGALIWLVMGPAAAVATTYIALDAKQIEADQAAIKAKQAAVLGLSADVAVLSLLSANFGNMATEATAIENNLQAVLSEWQTLENDINAAITDIRSAVSDTSAGNFQAVVNDLNDAVSEWTATYTQAGSLFLNLQVNDAQLQPGMSSSDVQVAMGSATTTDIISYYNNVGAAAVKRAQTA